MSCWRRCVFSYFRQRKSIYGRITQRKNQSKPLILRPKKKQGLDYGICTFSSLGQSETGANYVMWFGDACVGKIFTDFILGSWFRKIAFKLFFWNKHTWNAKSYIIFTCYNKPTFEWQQSTGQNVPHRERTIRAMSPVILRMWLTPVTHLNTVLNCLQRQLPAPVCWNANLTCRGTPTYIRQEV